MSWTASAARRRTLTLALVMMVAVAAIWLAQSDRVDAGTAAPPGEGISLVYVAVGTNFPDSLGVGPGGGVGAAPIIIVPTNPPIPAATAAELVRLDPRRLVIVGGTAVVSLTMETALASLLPNASIDRIAGANRYETNALFSQATFPVEGWVSIHAAAFTGGSPATDVVTIQDSGAGNASGGGILLAPIQLPHGAEVLELKALVEDRDAVVDVEVFLQRVTFGTTNFVFGDVVASVTTSGSPGFVLLSTTSIDPDMESIDNSTHLYNVTVTGTHGTETRITGVMVRYRLGAPGA